MVGQLVDEHDRLAGPYQSDMERGLVPSVCMRFIHRSVQALLLKTTNSIDIGNSITSGANFATALLKMIRKTSWKSWEKYLENMQSNNDNQIDVTVDNINVDFIDHTESFLNEQLS